MELAQIHDLVDRVFAVCATSASRDQVDSALTGLSQLEAVVAGRRLSLAGALARLSPTPEADLAAGLKSGKRDAKQTVERMHLAALAPDMAQALHNGEISITHLDKLSGALGRLSPADRQTLLDNGQALAAAAVDTTPEEFDQHLRAREREIASDNSARLAEAQHRAVRLRDWIGDDGMHNFKLSLDPLSGVKLHNLIRAATEARFHGGDVPAYAPDLPVDRQAFLRAHALLGLLFDGKGVRLGQPEVTVVVDTRVPAGAAPVVDWGLPVELPVATLQALAGRARVSTVWLDGDDLVWAPGRLDLGSASRIASPDQRRVLRAMYATCAIPRCDVPFDHCDTHHVIFWEDARRTDLAILVPLCSGHHHRLHAEGWQAELDPHRQFQIRLPNGRVLLGTPNRIDQTRFRSQGSAVAANARAQAPP